MTKQELNEIEARANAATDGPWMSVDSFIGVEDAEDQAIGETGRDKDAVFIAHARTDVPALIAEVRRLQGELETAQYCAMADETGRLAGENE